MKTLKLVYNEDSSFEYEVCELLSSEIYEDSLELSEDENID